MPRHPSSAGEGQGIRAPHYRVRLHYDARMMRPVAALIAVALVLGACASHPLPRTVGETGVGDPVRTFGVGGAERVYRDGAVYIASQPDGRALRAMSRRGVGLVVNLRHDKEMDGLSIDEPGVVASHAMAYAHLPMLGRELTPELVDRFAELVHDERRPVLLHCRTASRASMLWAAYLHRHRGVPLEGALAAARVIGLKDDGNMEVVRQVAQGVTPELDPALYPELFRDLEPDADEETVDDDGD